MNVPGALDTVKLSVSARERHRSMRARKVVFGLVLTASLTTTPGVVAGQTIPSPFRFVERRQEAGIFAGTSSVDAGRFGFGPEGGKNVGARWGVNLSGPLGFEVAGGLISGSRDIINPARAAGDRKVGEADVLLGTLDGRLRFTLTGDRTWHGLAPFILAGGGIAFDLAGSDPADDELEEQDRFDFGTSFFGTMGGGLRASVTDRIGLRGDALFSLWKLETPPGFSDPERGFEAVEQGQWVHGLHLSLSAVIRF
jgi:hypothetical protein